MHVWNEDSTDQMKSSNRHSMRPEGIQKQNIKMEI